MTTVYLIRHAEAEGNLYRRAQGHYNSTITDRGYRQIAALAKRFADIPIDAVYSSDLARTCTTALAVTCPKKLPLHTSEQLREVGMGVWEDRTWAENRLLAALGLHTRQAAPAAAKQPAPLSDTERRVLACIGPKPVGIEELCVSTGLPMSALLGILMKLELTGRVYKQPGQRYVLR